ncbi:MAG: AAA family ATPase [Candidatus Pacebacteria bacterium]|nr:AAA family ATPase [Candidatus Paceibacterota bacterium]
MIDVIDKMHNTLVVLDEPESGLSLRNQFIFLKTIQAATQRGCQFLIATHAPLFIESHCVFSLDDYAWHSGKAYIQQVRKSLQ